MKLKKVESLVITQGFKNGKEKYFVGFKTIR